jgi:hypothetical protein
MSFSVKKTGLLARLNPVSEPSPAVSSADSILFDIDSKLDMISNPSGKSSSSKRSGKSSFAEPDRKGGFSMKSTDNSVEDYM